MTRRAARSISLRSSSGSATDFVAKYGVEQGYGDHSAAQRAALHFVSGYLDKEDAEYLSSGDYSISYLDYDWSLNEQK